MTDSVGSFGARDLLRLPAYRTLWLAQLVSDVGDSLTNIALLLLVNALTGSTAAIAAMAIALAIPPLTIGLVAGTYVDRWDRRRIMLAADLIRSVLVLGFILVANAGQLPLLYVIAFAQASIGTFFNPARGALIPRIVPTGGLLVANSISQATRVIASVGGTAVAGGLIGLAGVFWPAFVLDGASFFVSFLLVSRLPAAIGLMRPDERSAGRPGVRSSLAEGLRVVTGSRVLWVTMGSLSLAMLGLGAINVLFVPLIVNVLHESPVWFGPLEGAQTASMVLAAGLAGVIAARLRPTTIVVVGSLGVGLTIGLVGAVSAVWQVMVLMFAVGWFITPFQAAVVTILQSHSTDATRGRVMSLLNASMSATSVVSMAAGGLLAASVGVSAAFLLGGAVCVLSGVAALALYPRRTASAMTDRRVAEPAS